MARPVQKDGYGYSSSYSLEPEENHKGTGEPAAQKGRINYSADLG